MDAGREILDRLHRTMAQQGGVPLRGSPNFAPPKPKSSEPRGRNRRLPSATALPAFFGGVPMHWMNDWPTPFPIVVDHARGATITDIDGNRLDDFCLGDTGSMFGHSPPAGGPRDPAPGRRAA